MKIIFKSRATLMERVRHDLSRSHRFALERVGFLSVRAAAAGRDIVLLAEDYHPVADDDYVDDASVGAMMGQEAIRKALEIALLNSVGIFHIHMHEHAGEPHFSRTDLREQPKFVPDFFKVRREMPHGAIVLSHDYASGRAWLTTSTVLPIDEFDLVGSPMSIGAARRTGRVDFWA